MSMARPTRPRDTTPVSGTWWRLRAVAATIAAVVVAAAATGQELLPGPEQSPAVPPPEMYITDPLDADGFAGIPSGVQAERLPGWPRWFAGATGLVMTRTLPEGAATMQPLGGLNLSTSDASATWPGGVDLHVGRWFGPRQHNAVELIYWGLFGIGSSGSVASPAGGIQAIPNTSGVTVNGTAASAILGNASAQRISRSDLVNDVEINWLYSLWERPEFQPRERRVNLMWLAGFRFFELQDVLTLATTSGADQLDFNVATNNNLYGGQVGAKFDWRFAPRLRFSAVPKMLVAGNAITNTSSLTASDGTAAVFTGTGAPVNVHSTLGVFSWLGSVDTAVAWDVTERWSLWMGYRVVGVGNVAQADQQWPTLITNASSLSGVTAGGSTILHGGFAGFEGRY
jgi:hypothetical protein